MTELAAALRSSVSLARVAGSTSVKLLAESLWREPTSTTTADGLVKVASFGRAALARLGVDLEVLHAERVPSRGGLVFMWNQESHLDHLVLPCAIPRPFFSTYNNAVARVPLYARHLRRAGHVHLDRDDETQWRAAVALAARRVHGGECVLVSPEGTRSRGGQLLPMKRGAFLLAVQSRQPIVCVTVIGGAQRLPRDAYWVRPGPMRVVLGEPIATEDATLDDHEALKQAVVETFTRTKAALRG
ncbi:MAG: 1-acyl-sn-glycerol-3-phosphate acyltransferase [Deltaproteobacteria bacterium]|nr:1-acyl-sn-glycerol-3-phosphate acyltransferase [Deltaproteobacteria bacterium]